MAERWKCSLPVAVHSGAGCTDLLSRHVANTRTLLVTTQGMLRRRTAETLMAGCPDTDWLVRTTQPNPPLADLDAAISGLRTEKVDNVVALGGGSAMDSAKAIAFSLRQSAPDWSLKRHFYEDGLETRCEALPLWCIPTTAGTGSEATPFATIWDEQEKRKLSLDMECLYPRAAFLDPVPTCTLPWKETLWGALDTLSHGMETLWGKKATPVSLALAREALHQALRFLPLVEKTPENIEARAGMQTASLMAGMAISQNRTALAHAISYPLTLRFNVPHGLACSFTLPALTEAMNTHGLWRDAEDRALADRVNARIRQYNLPKELASFADIDSVLSLTDEMFTPARAENFIVPIARADMGQLLHAALTGNCCIP